MTEGTMTGLDYFSWLVLIVIIVSIVVLFIALARLPGQMAKKRGHPHAEAINVAGWLGLLLTLGVVWALSMVWAFIGPAGGADAPRGPAELDDPDEVARLKARVAELEAELEREHDQKAEAAT